MAIGTPGENHDIVEETINHKLIVDAIDEAICNWVSKYSRTEDPVLVKKFETYVVDILKLNKNEGIKFPLIEEGGIIFLVNQVEKFVLDKENNDLKNIMNKFLEDFSNDYNKDIKDSGLHKYSLKKIAKYSILVNEMLKKGLDPELLNASDEDFSKYQIRLIQSLVQKGVGTIIVGENDEVSSEKGLKWKLKNLNSFDLLEQQPRYIYEFAEFLTTHISDTLTPEGFKLACESALYNLENGIDGITGEPIQGVFVGYPKGIYYQVRKRIPEISDAIFKDKIKYTVDDVIDLIKKVQAG